MDVFTIRVVQGTRQFMNCLNTVSNSSKFENKKYFFLTVAEKHLTRIFGLLLCSQKGRLFSPLTILGQKNKDGQNQHPDRT